MTLIPIDKAGVESREKSFNDRIQQLWDEMQAIGNQFSALTIQTQDVMRVGQERREEGYRLSNQLEILRNDKFAAAEQQRVLEDELVRLEENKRRLERRQNQLKQQLGRRAIDSLLAIRIFSRTWRSANIVSECV